MKRSTIILFSLFLVVTGLIYIPVFLNKKTSKTEIKKESKTVFVPILNVQNSPHTLSLKSYGQVSPISELMVSFEVQGRLNQGKKRLKPGVNFSAGELLYSLDFEEAAYSVFARKSALAGIISQAMPDIQLDFPNQTAKWERFLDALTPSAVLPELPEFSNKKERLFWTARNVLAEYYNIAALDKRMEKYFYRAPFSGTVVEIYSEPGAVVNPGVQIAKIARTGDFEIKVPVAMDVLADYKSKNEATFTDPSGKVVATGKIIRVSDVINQRTQSADVYYSVKPVNGANIYNGLYLNVGIDVNTERYTSVLPRTAVKESKVMVLENAKIKTVDVLVIGDKPDSVYVKGLSNGQQVLLEQIGTPAKDVIYKGIQR